MSDQSALKHFLLIDVPNCGTNTITFLKKCGEGDKRAATQGLMMDI